MLSNKVDIFTDSVDTELKTQILDFWSMAQILLLPNLFVQLIVDRATGKSFQ